MSTCAPPVSLRTFDRSLNGVKSITNLGDGYSVSLSWNKYYQTPISWTLVYNLYWSSVQGDVFKEGVKFVLPSTQLHTIIKGGFKRGDVYYFGVRAAAHEPGTLLFDQLPEVDGMRMYPETVLTQNISATDTIIPVMDASLFPPTGLVLIGSEIISYSAIDLVDNNLILFSEDQRGLYGHQARPHTTDGYDGVEWHSPIVALWRGFEDGNSVVGLTEIKFDLQYARTNEDGYRMRVDIVSGGKNLDVIDAANTGFPIYDQTGWDRTFMPDYLSGKCVGTYFGGEYGCADGYEDDGPIRGLGIQDFMNMREEYLLQITGEPCALFRRQWSGIESKYHNSSRENTIYRGLDTFGTTLAMGYEQYFNPRYSDGRTLIRFGPTKEDYKRDEPGIENVYIPDCWTLVVPTVKDGDFIIRFNQDGTEEWRYEIIDVTRNRSFLTQSGLQKFTCVRVRKTDPIYQVRAFRDTSMFPKEILTGIGSTPGPGGLPPHMHRIVVNENITSVSQINQMTSVDQGHNHSIVNGVIQTVVGHSHVIVL